VSGARQQGPVMDTTWGKPTKGTAFGALGGSTRRWVKASLGYDEGTTEARRKRETVEIMCVSWMEKTWVLAWRMPSRGGAGGCGRAMTTSDVERAEHAPIIDDEDAGQKPNCCLSTATHNRQQQVRRHMARGVVRPTTMRKTHRTFGAAAK
jgi:hypothetical protein